MFSSTARTLFIVVILILVMSVIAYALTYFFMNPSASDSPSKFSANQKTLTESNHAGSSAGGITVTDINGNTIIPLTSEDERVTQDYAHRHEDGGDEFANYRYGTDNYEFNATTGDVKLVGLQGLVKSIDYNNRLIILAGGSLERRVVVRGDISVQSISFVSTDSEESGLPAIPKREVRDIMFSDIVPGDTISINLHFGSDPLIYVHDKN